MMNEKHPAAGARTASAVQKKAETELMGAVREQKMLHYIKWLSIFCMIGGTLLVDCVLRAVLVYVDTYIAVYYPSTAVTVLQWSLYYLLIILTYAYQCLGYGLLGYSVLRYGVKKSIVPIILLACSATIAYGAGIAEIVYLAGTTAIQRALSYYLSYWILNYFLSLFTCLSLVFLCSLIRVAFMRQKKSKDRRWWASRPQEPVRLRVEICDEPAASRKQNVLRRLYLWMTGLLFFFRFVMSTANMFSEIAEVGAPRDIWDVITLLQPYAELLLLAAMGYYIMLYVGGICTRKNREITEDLHDAAQQ